MTRGGLYAISYLMKAFYIKISQNKGHGHQEGHLDLPQKDLELGLT